jgi:putative transposase
MPTQEPYPSNLTDSEWEQIEPLLPKPKLFGRPPRYTKRAILDAIFYVVRSGCAWRMLPHDLPPWRIVYYYFMVWRREGLWQGIHDTLRDRVRLRSGKKKPRPLRSSTLRALKYLTTEECAATMRERRSWDASDTSWWIRWV